LQSLYYGAKKFDFDGGHFQIELIKQIELGCSAITEQFPLSKQRKKMPRGQFFSNGFCVSTGKS
jgi:hypothetical protein